MPFSILQALPKLKGFIRIICFCNRVARWAARRQHHAHILPVHITGKRLVVLGNAAHRQRRIAGRRSQQHRLLVIDIVSTRIETVDNGFKLRAERKIINRRHQRNYIGFPQFLDGFIFDIVLMHAWPAHAAGIAAKARMNIAERRVITVNFVPFALCAFNKFISQ